MTVQVAQPHTFVLRSSGCQQPKVEAPAFPTDTQARNAEEVPGKGDGREPDFFIN